MGSNFFSKAMGGGLFSKLLDPISSFAGPHSFISKTLNSLPGANYVAKIDPALADNRRAYAAEHTTAPVGYAPFAGKAPSLADANNDYMNAAISAGQNAAKTGQPATVPLASPTRSPLVPAMWQPGRGQVQPQPQSYGSNLYGQ